MTFSIAFHALSIYRHLMPTNLPPPPFARLDRATGSVRVDPASLDIAAALSSGLIGPLPDAAWSRVHRLLDAGLLERGSRPEQLRLTQPLADVLRVVTGSCVGVRVLAVVGARAHAASLLLGVGRSAFVVHEPDGTYTLSTVPTPQATEATIRFVGFVPPTPSVPSRGLALAPVALDEFHRRLSEGDAPAAAAALGPQRGLTAQELELLLDLVEGRARSWKVITPEATVTVVDGGARGAWRSGTALGGRFDHELVPVAPTELEHLLDQVLHAPAPAFHAA
jgi:hypothetical protein